TEHSSRHAEARGAGKVRHRLALFPVGVVRVAAGDLHDVDAEPVHEPLQLGDVLDLQRPAAHADGQRFDCHESISIMWPGPRRIPWASCGMTRSDAQPPGAGSMQQPSGPRLALSQERTSWKVWICSTFNSATSFGPVQITDRPVVCACSMSWTARSLAQ